MHTQTQYPVLVEVPATAVDEDTGAAVGKKFVLSAPAGNSDFISPLTTMVQNQIEANPDLTVDEAEDALITSMGKDPASVSLFIDYVEAKNDSTNAAADDYNTLHNIAQVTARTLANNIETIETAIADGSVNLTIDEAFDALIQIVVEEVVAQLAVITADVETAEAASGDGTIDADAVTTSTNVAVDTATVETEVAVVEATNSASSATFQHQLADGFNWIWGEIGSDWQELEYGTVTVVDGVASETQNQYNFSTGAFEGSTSSSDIYLGANGWATGTDDLSDCSIVFNSDGSGTFTCLMETFTISSQEVDVTGLNVAAYLGSTENGGFTSLIDSTAVFSSSAKAYIMSFTSDTASYSLYGDSGSSVLNTGGASTTLGDLLSSAAWVNDDNSEPKAVWAGFSQSPEGCIEEAYSSNPATDTLCTRSQGMIIELVGSGTSGTANFYLTDYVNRNTTSNFHSVNKVAASTWSIQTINGAEILSYETPASVTSTYAYLFEDNSDGEQRIYSVYNNTVYEGDYTPAGASDSGEVAFNNTAIADVINSITGGGGGTGGGGTTPVPTVNPVAGVWGASNVDGSFNYMILFDDNTFMYGENDLTVQQATENGLEMGTYSYDSTASEITFNLTYDDNEAFDEVTGDDIGSGIGSVGTPVTIPASSDGSSLSLLNGDFVLPAVSGGASPLEGVWRTADSCCVLAMTGGAFIFGENDAEPDNGLEAGSYTDNGDGTVTLTVSFDENGPGNDSGVGDVGVPLTVGFVADGTTLTLIDTVTATPIIEFTREF